MISVGQIVIVFIIVIVNGFFVAAEASLLTVRKTHIAVLRSKGNKLAKLIEIAIANINLYVTATQLGNTFASILLGWLGHPVIEGLLLRIFPVIQTEPYVFWHTTVIALAAFGALTLFNLIFGELLPKIIAISNPEIYSFIIITPLFIFTKIFLPVIRSLSWLSTSLFKLTGLTQKRFLSYDDDEIQYMLDEWGRNNLISKGEKTLAAQLFRLNELKTKEIMVHKSNLLKVHTHDNIEDIKRKMADKYISHHHFPVLKPNSQQVVGIVRLIDLVNPDTKRVNGKKVVETNLMKKLVYARDNETLDDLFMKMKKRQIYLAAIVDKYNNFIGLITLNDIMRTLTGAKK